jgi:hypothetical protein
MFQGQQPLENVTKGLVNHVANIAFIGYWIYFVKFQDGWHYTYQIFKL